MTIFEDHMIRDINAGRFRDNTSLVLLTHGLALRVFLMRWFHWTVDQFMNVYNPPNAEVRGIHSDKTYISYLPTVPISYCLFHIAYFIFPIFLFNTSYISAICRA